MEIPGRLMTFPCFIDPPRTDPSRSGDPLARQIFKCIDILFQVLLTLTSPDIGPQVVRHTLAWKVSG